MKKKYDSEPIESKVEQIQQRFRDTQKAWERQYKLSLEDVNFCSVDNQWPSDVRAARQGRPSLATDRLNAQVKQITNAQRENRPACTVHAVNGEADEDTANVIQGMMRHIEYQSGADMAYDEAMEWQVRAGIGYFRILTAYEKNSFDQKVCIESVNNPFMVFPDPTYQKLDGSDLEYCFILTYMTKEEFKREFPNSKLSTFDYQGWLGLNNRLPEWFSEDAKSCVVAEYFEKSYESVQLVHLSSGETKRKDECSAKELKKVDAERTLQEPVIKWYKLGALEILEETEWPGSYIPIIPVFGDPLLEDGNRIYSGLIRNAKEQQMMLNTVITATIEMIARAPKNPYLVPEGAIGDQAENWANVNVLDLPYLTYQPFAADGVTPLPIPQRETAEPPIQGMLSMLNVLENSIKSTNSMYDPQMGQKMSNDQSGMAIKALQQQGNIASYHFSDNLNRAIRLCGHMLLDLFPKIYSEKRVIRIVGIDDKHSLVQINGIPSDPDNINGMDENGVRKVFDITVGEYDVCVDSGPSYQTRRAENLNKLLELAGKDPQLMAVAGDLIASQMDFPAAPELVKRLEKVLPPQLQPQADQNRPDPSVLQQQLTEAHQVISQMTEALQKETQLADKEQQTLQLKLKIAQMEQDNQTQRQAAQLQHDTAKIDFMESVRDLRDQQTKEHELLKGIHQHLLAKDMATHQTALQIASSPETLAPMPPIPNQTISTAQ